jgi:hypothetical protein
MAERDQWMIYGSNGYTGRLIAVEVKRRGLRPVLAGRSAGPIQKLASELGLPSQIFDLRDVAAVSDRVVTVFGGTGFLVRRVVRRLTLTGHAGTVKLDSSGCARSGQCGATNGQFSERPMASVA